MTVIQPGNRRELSVGVVKNAVGALGQTLYDLPLLISGALSERAGTVMRWIE